jgi:hypothetical protein
MVMEKIVKNVTEEEENGWRRRREEEHDDYLVFNLN